VIDIHTLTLEFVAAYAERRDGAEPLPAGDLLSSGTLPESTPLQPGVTWTAAIEGIDRPVLTRPEGCLRKSLYGGVSAIPTANSHTPLRRH
jgi:hypothetical protein